MHIQRLSLLLCTLGLLLPALATAVPESASKQPNIVIVVSDDGGYADFGFNNCPDFKTPNIDTLASQGTIFRNGYVSASVCSPSRAGLLSGRYQTRFGHEFNLPMGRQDTTGLPLTEKLLSDRLKAAGYATAAFGKWHLGSGKGYWPSERGFDYTYIFLKGSRAYMPESQIKDNDTVMRLNGKPQLLTEYLTDAISRQTADYITSQKDTSKPIFLYIAYNCPHSPLQAKPGMEEKFPELKGARKTIAAMQASLDEGIGTIVKALKETGRWDNTIFWFINDNGGATYGNFNNGGLRNNKGSLFDGGIKVAWFAHFPKSFKAPREYTAPAISLDIAATSLAAAHIPVDSKLEGINLLPTLTNQAQATNRPLFWRQRNIGAIRDGDWKLILLDGTPTQLFNLTKDPSERQNLVDNDKDTVDRLAKLYASWDKNNIAALWRGEGREGLSHMYEKDAPWNARRAGTDRETPRRKRP